MKDSLKKLVPIFVEAVVLVFNTIKKKSKEKK